MPNPTLSDVHVNRPLTNMAMNWIQDDDVFLSSSDLLPYIGNQSKSDVYFEYDKGDLNRDEAKLRAPGTESAGSGFRVDNTQTFTALKYAIHQDVPYDNIDNQDEPLDIERSAMDVVMQKLMIKQDRDFASTFMTSGPWVEDNELDITAATDSGGDSVTDLTGTAWDASSGSDPIGDFRYAKSLIADAWRAPNLAIMGRDVFEVLKDHSDIVDRYKYTTPPSQVSAEEILASVLEIDNVFVPESKRDTAAENATTSMGYNVPSDSVLLMYVPDNPSLITPSAGYVYGWEGMRGADGLNIRVKRLEIPEREVVRIEGEMAYDMKVTSDELGVYLYDTLGDTGESP